MIETINKAPPYAVQETEPKDHLDEVKLWQGILFMKDGRTWVCPHKSSRKSIENWVVKVHSEMFTFSKSIWMWGAEFVCYGREYSHGMAIPAKDGP